jgi:AcrR family transcriptional regulator
MIVDAAMSLIDEQGLSATSARDIANAAGVSLGTLTYHFESVDEILVQVLTALVDRFERRRATRLADYTDPLESLCVCLNSYLDPEIYPRAMWRMWLDCWARAARSPMLRNWQLARYSESYDEVEAIIADGIARGRFPPADARECARELLALLDGLAEQMLIDAEMSSEQAIAILDGAVRRRLGATAAERLERETSPPVSPIQEAR